jgi:hypothetical protein
MKSTDMKNTEVTKEARKAQKMNCIFRVFREVSVPSVFSSVLKDKS